MPVGGWDFHRQAAPPDSIQLAQAWRPYIDTCIDLFGPQRCMFESNFPVDKGMFGYVSLWNAFKRLTVDLSASERTALFSATAPPGRSTACRMQGGDSISPSFGRPGVPGSSNALKATVQVQTRSGVSHDADGLPPRQRFLAIATVVLGITIAVLDGSIANLALPAMAADLKASDADAIWVINSYQIAMAVCLLPLASLGEVVGYRRVYLGGLFLFTLASLACAASNDMLQLSLARVLQGLERGRHPVGQYGADPLHLPGAPAGPRHRLQRPGGRHRQCLGPPWPASSCTWRPGTGCS
jgi:hypothetical protein